MTLLEQRVASKIFAPLDKRKELSVFSVKEAFATTVVTLKSLHFLYCTVKNKHKWTYQKIIYFSFSVIRSLLSNRKGQVILSKLRIGHDKLTCSLSCCSFK